MKIYRTALVNLVFKGLGIALSILVNWYLVRSLSVENFGVFSYYSALIVAAAAPLGTSASDFVVRMHGRAGGSYAEIQKVISFSVCAVLVCSSLYAVALLLLSAVEENSLYPSIVILISVPVYSLIYVCGGYLRSEGYPTLGVFPEQVLRQLSFFLISFFIFNYFGVVSLELILTINMISLLVTLFLAIRIISIRIPNSYYVGFFSTEGDVEKFGIWLKIFLSFVLLSGIQAISSQSPLILLGHYGFHSDSANYRVADLLSGLNALPLLISLSLVGPIAIRAKSQQDNSELKIVLGRLFYFTVFIASTATVTIYFYGGEILTTLFGSSYSAAYSTLLVLTGGTFFSAITGPVGLVLIMFGHEKTVIKMNFLVMAVQLAVSFLVVQPYGSFGVAFAVASGKALLSIMLSVTLIRHERISVFPNFRFNRLNL